MTTLHHGGDGGDGGSGRKVGEEILIISVRNGDEVKQELFS